MTLTLHFPKVQSPIFLQIAEAERAAGTETNQALGKMVAKKIGGNPRSHATIWGDYKLGKRPLPKKMLVAISEILKLSTELFEKANVEVTECLTEFVFDGTEDISELVKLLPKEYTTIPQLMIWIKTELDKKKFLSKM